MDPILAIGLIGGGLVAVKVLGDKNAESGANPGSGDSAGVGANPAFETKPDVAANAATMGYKLISKDEYERHGVQQGEYYVIRDSGGNITGTVVGTEGGQVFQGPNGETRVRTSGDDEIEIESPEPSNTGIAGGVMTGPPPLTAKKSAAVQSPPIFNLPSQMKNTTTTNTPSLAVRRPKAAIATKLLDSRIRASARAGLRIPM